MGRRLADIRYRVVRVPNPAAGAEFDTSPTGSFFWVVRSVVFTLVTDATVANRTAGLSLSDATTAYWRATAGEAQAASLTRRYSAFPGADGSLVAGDVRGIPLDSYGLIVPPGNVLTSDTQNLQAGDQLSSIALHVFEMETGWIAPAVPTVNLFIEEFDPTFAG